ncbi:MAG: asparagine synthase-related protein [Methanocellales archaeon]|nr:asparagine synthase-related protein [Methanocellales archaeon]
MRAPDELISDEETAVNLLRNALQRAVDKRVGQKTGIAFSGGVDSSLIAALAKGSKITLYSVGLENSQDVRQAKHAAELLNLRNCLRPRVITPNDIESFLPRVIKVVKSADLTQISIGTPLFIAAEKAHKDGIKIMLSGQGADELFAGYHRHVKVFEKGADVLHQEVVKGIKNIAEVDLRRDTAVTAANFIELRTPYLDEEVVEVGLRIAPKLKIRKTGEGYKNKYILRRLAEDVIPHEIAWKEKKAVQYGSGVHRALDKLSRAHGFRGIGRVNRYLISIAEKCDIPLEET